MMSDKAAKGRLGVKELVNIGIFTAVYFVVFFIAASTGTVPIMTVLYPVLSAILAGIPMILFFAKVNRFGMVTLLCLLSGLINFAGGAVQCHGRINRWNGSVLYDGVLYDIHHQCKCRNRSDGTASSEPEDYYPVYGSVPFLSDDWRGVPFN